MSVQDKIAELERQVARKKALVNAKVILPKETPDEIKSEIGALIQEALLKLADDTETNCENGFTFEEISVLKQLANRALSKTMTSNSNLVPNTAVNIPLKIRETVVVNKGDYQGRDAEIMSLDAVPVRQRGKVGPMEQCRVMEEREDGLLNILTKGGVRFNVAVEDLNFDIQSN